MYVVCMCVCCEMIITVSLLNICHHRYLKFFFFLWGWEKLDLCLKTSPKENIDAWGVFTGEFYQKLKNYRHTSFFRMCLPDTVGFFVFVSLQIEGSLQPCTDQYHFCSNTCLLCVGHILEIFIISQTSLLLLYLLWWSVIFDIVTMTH